MLQRLLHHRLGTLCRLGYLGLALCFTSAGAWAQTTTMHSVTLNWTDTLNPATGTTYNIYRATGLCSGTPVFSKIATAITAKAYADTTVTPGNYCYTVTATVNSVESAQSATAGPAVPAFVPTGLFYMVQ